MIIQNKTKQQIITKEIKLMEKAVKKDDLSPALGNSFVKKNF